MPYMQQQNGKKKVPYNFGSISLGSFDADVCTKCGEVFFTEEASDAIDAKAKSLTDSKKHRRFHEAEKRRGNSNKT